MTIAKDKRDNKGEKKELFPVIIFTVKASKSIVKQSVYLYKVIMQVHTP